MAEAEKEIENKRKEIKKRGEKNSLEIPYRIEIEKRKYGIDIYHKWDETEGTISFYDLDLIEYYNAKKIKWIYGTHIIAAIINISMVLSTIIIACLMRRFYSEKIQILSFFKLYDSIVSLPVIILIAGIILLFVYIFVGYRVIIDKRKSDISWRVKNKEKNAISNIRLCLLMDMNFNSGITLAYYFIYIIMFYGISVIYIYIIRYCILLCHSFALVIAVTLFIFGLIEFLYIVALLALSIAYMVWSLAILIPFFLFFVLSFTDNNIVSIIAVCFTLIEILPSEDFWLVMSEQIPLKHIKNSTEKIKRLVKRNIYIIKVKRLLIYLIVLIAIYKSEEWNLIFFIPKEVSCNRVLCLIFTNTLKVINRIMWIAILTLLTWGISKAEKVKKMIEEVKDRLYDMIYKDVNDYVLVTPSIKEKVRLSISHANRIDPKLLVKNMEDLPDETKVFIEKINRIKKTCRVVVVMPDLTIHSGIVEFEPK